MFSERFLELIADFLDVKPEELGIEWVDFARTVSGFIVCSPSDNEVLGRLLRAAVALP